MSLPIVLRAEAETEFDEAFDWYDARRAGLGDEFTAEVQKVFDRISANPLIHQEVFADIRKAVRQFRTASTTDRTRIGSRSSQSFTPAATPPSGRAAPEEKPMLFGGIDWNQVLMQGLIGGVIGAVVGLVVYIGKKATGKDKRNSDDGA